MTRNVVIAGYARTPFTFANKGELIRVRPDELAAAAVRGLIERTGWMRATSSSAPGSSR